MVKEERKFYTHILVKVKKEDKKIKINESCITTAPLAITQEKGVSVVTVDMNNYNEEEKFYRGCYNLIDAWEELGDILELISYFKDDIEFLDFPMEIECENYNLELKSLVTSTFEDNILRLEYLECNIQKIN